MLEYHYSFVERVIIYSHGMAAFSIAGGKTVWKQKLPYVYSRMVDQSSILSEDIYSIITYIPHTLYYSSEIHR